MSALLAVDGLNKVYHRNSLFESTDRSVHAVRDVSFSVRQGEILGIVGESGCGKSTLARAVFFLERPTSGTVRFRGVDVSSMRGAELLRFRKHAQVVFQDPHGALNPRLRVGRSLEEGLIAQRVARARRRDRVRELMEVVGLDEHYLTAYPHELSGGQRQRVVIARALAVDPELLVLDEPVSSLDVSIQAQIVNLLLELKERLDLTYVFISHDLNLVAYLSDRIGVMKRGEIVELAPTDALVASPESEYTRKLFESSPRYEDRRVIRHALSGRKI